MKKDPVTVCLNFGRVLILTGVIVIFWAFKDWASVAFIPSYSPNQVGRMVLVGEASATDSQRVENAPVSQTPCITYELSVLRYVSTGKHPGGYSRFFQEEQGFDNLSVQTPVGPVQIKPEKLDLGYLEDKQYANSDFDQPSTRLALRKRHITTRLLGLRLGLKVKESSIRAGDEITVIGKRVSTEEPPVLENAIVSDRTIKQMVAVSRKRLKYGFSELLIGSGFLMGATKFADANATDEA